MRIDILKQNLDLTTNMKEIYILCVYIYTASQFLRFRVTALIS